MNNSNHNAMSFAYLNLEEFEAVVIQELNELVPPRPGLIHMRFAAPTKRNVDLLNALENLTRKSFLQKLLKLETKLSTKNLRRLAILVHQERNASENEVKLDEMNSMLYVIQKNPDSVYQPYPPDLHLDTLEKRITERAGLTIRQHLGTYSSSQLNEISRKLDRIIIPTNYESELIKEQLEWFQNFLKDWEFELSFERPERWLKELQSLDPNNPEWSKEIERLKQLKKISIEEHKSIEERRKEVSQQKAEELLRRKEFIKHICPALQTVSNDAYEITKVVTPILLGLAIAGTISIPFVPILFASIGLLIARMGIASFCTEHKKEQEKDSVTK